jgi:hypothetical protein
MDISQIKGRAAVQAHIRSLFFGHPITVISVQDQVAEMDISSWLSSESRRRDGEDVE